MSTDERRRFARVHFDAEADLRQGSTRWRVPVLDLSLHGLLLQRPDNWSGKVDETFQATIELGADIEVVMEVRLARDGDKHLAFKCEHLDVDSMSHLRRLLELNLGDASLLERELATLIDIHS